MTLESTTTMELQRPVAVRSSDWLGRVLVACEYSGIVRDAFAAAGWDAWSCDTLPSERPGKHYQGDVRDILNEGWDMMIGHPPCTYLCKSGVRWLYNPDKTRNEPRWKSMEEGAQFFLTLWNAPIPKIVLENPIMHKYAQRIIGVKWSQIIHPWQHGHECTKATCLWVKGELPALRPTKIVGKGTVYVDRRGIKHGSDFIMRAKVGYSPLMLLPKTSERWKIRSRTFQGIGDAFANQWTPATRPNNVLSGATTDPGKPK